ncbi:MAG: insulinase family protein [Elusimicrobia bacterium]|nr:insulinase family protein [Elusimicrobiota bacterium]
MEIFKVNGIKILYKQNKKLPIVWARVFTGVAAGREDTAGIANLCARIMSKSTLKRNVAQLSKDIDSIGASLETDMDYDFSAISISSLSNYFSQSLEILADVIINPAFNESEIEFEKKNVLASISARRDSISKTARDAFAREYFNRTPFANPIAGNIESVKSISKENIKNWRAKAYNAREILIVVAGNVSKAEVKVAVEKYFSALPKGKVLPIPKTNFPKLSGKRVNISGKFSQAYILKGYTAPDIKNENFATLKVITALLGSRMSARLFVELREKLGLAYEVNALYPTFVNKSYFGVYMGLDKKNVGLAERKMEEILKDLGINKVSRAELKNVQNYISGVYLLDRQTLGRQSYYLGWREITGLGYKYDEKYLKQILKVTPQDIYKAAKKYFNNPALTVTVMPEEKPKTAKLK